MFDVTLHVLNVNEPPTEVHLAPPEGGPPFNTTQPNLGENAPAHTVVGLLQAFDPDLEDTISFRVDSDAFSVEEDPTCTNAILGVRTVLCLPFPGPGCTKQDQ